MSWLISCREVHYTNGTKPSRQLARWSLRTPRSPGLHTATLKPFSRRSLACIQFIGLNVRIFKKGYTRKLRNACAARYRQVVGAGVMDTLVEHLNNGEVRSQIYAAQTLAKMAGDPDVQDRMVAIGAVTHFVGIIRDNVGAAPAAAAAIERLACQPKFATAVVRQGGVAALVGLLNAGAREAFLPTMRTLKHLSSMFLSCSAIFSLAPSLC